ncbi:MAG: hypothetical protein PHT90_06020 [Bacilli bacterium]|nr:hypothetical protein [Bacilli bacterium]
MDRIDILNMISSKQISVDEGLRLFETLDDEKQQNTIKKNNSLKNAINNLDCKMKKINRDLIEPNVKKAYKGIKKGFKKLDKQIVKLMGEDL